MVERTRPRGVEFFFIFFFFSANKHCKSHGSSSLMVKSTSEVTLNISQSHKCMQSSR